MRGCKAERLEQIRTHQKLAWAKIGGIPGVSTKQKKLFAFITEAEYVVLYSTY